jgi:hypothetical protein
MIEAPRWRLLAAHYLNVATYPDGTRIEWEHKETNAINGRAVRKLFPVPLLLDPETSTDHNYPGEIIVTQEAEGAHCLMQDLIFLGPPTRDMEPLNDAAEEISNQHRARWTNPVETLPANGGMNSAEMEFMQNMMKAFAGQQSPTVPNTSVSREAYDALQERLAKLEALIIAVNKPAADASVRREVFGSAKTRLPEATV